MTRFENNIFRVRVESVKTNNEQEPIPESMQYSVIRDLLQVVEGPGGRPTSSTSGRGKLLHP
jgi:hypothetical protein